MSQVPETEIPVSQELRPGFHGRLDEIDDLFVTGAMAVADALPRLTEAFLAGDRDAMTEAVELSVRTGDVMEEVGEKGFVLLALEAPVANDLRRLVALLRITSDVERSAALLKHVCLTLDRFDPRFQPEGLRQQLAELARRATGVFTSGIDAWRRRDALAVHEIDDADEGVDRLQQRLLDQAASLEGGDELLVIGLIARYFERIADHGVAIAQDATFVATGQRVQVGKRRHRNEPGRDAPEGNTA